MQQAGETGVVYDASTATLTTWDQPPLLWLWDLSASPAPSLQSSTTSHGQQDPPVISSSSLGKAGTLSQLQDQADGDRSEMWADQRGWRRNRQPGPG